MVSDGKEVLIPLKDEIITHVDIDRKKVTVQLPEGLMDIYNE
jgi:ribosomal 30S subunit maturation factor RimM